jgi:hypothetical protein
MAAISRISVTIHTGARSNAGTDGFVYLGIAGREFALTSAADVDAFEPNSIRTYRLGASANIANAGDNDPRRPWQLDSRDIPCCPRYVRFEPAGGSPDWNVERVTIQVTTAEPGGGTAEITLARLGRTRHGSSHVWLGHNIGKVIYLP